MEGKDVGGHLWHILDGEEVQHEIKVWLVEQSLPVDLGKWRAECQLLSALLCPAACSSIAE